jgi:hypothetical protein
MTQTGYKVEKLSKAFICWTNTVVDYHKPSHMPKQDPERGQATQHIQMNEVDRSHIMVRKRQIVDGGRWYGSVANW